jgi:pimeloyl-ACP methyl ester carboxylesterase
MRNSEVETLTAPPDRAGAGIIEPVIGRYLRLTLSGATHRVYFEEAGTGVPLICLHTAGADGRQYRALLNDAEITRNFRVIAFDMPGHGKSSPVSGYEQREYRLTSALYVEMILAVADALGLDKPVLMGCSIGGRIVLKLAAEHASRFRALIGLQSAAAQAPWYDTEWLHRPDVHGGEVCAGLISGLIAPGGPEADRHETLWHYLQSGPGVFKGDLFFYRSEGDVTELLPKIDTAACPLFLLTGEYDFSCTPEDTRRTAAAIPGARTVIMERLGHFPMSENPGQFRKYLMPVLDEILAGQADSKSRENNFQGGNS